MHTVAPATRPLRTGAEWSLLGTHPEAQVAFAASDRSLLHAEPADRLEDHLRRYGPRPVTTARAGELLLRSVEAAELSGRGGAHFPVARKWRTALEAAQAGGREVLVVANGAEGEPASAKDAALLLQRPHLVLDGLVCAAETLGASSAVLWLHEGASAVEAVGRALAERRAAGAVEPDVRVATGPDRYLTGEGNAVVAALDGGPALPAFLRRPAAVAGVDGRPTVVQNVETLARVALLARTGASGPIPGVLTSVLSRSTEGRWAVVVRELAPFRTVAEAVLDGYWAAAPKPGAVLVGGYGGRWMHWDDAAPLALGRLAARPAPGGVSLGAGVIAPLPDGACGVRETAAVVDYLAASSARQCGPCLFGTRALADAWSRIARGAARRGDEERLHEVSAEISSRGACRLPDAAVSLTLSARDVFLADLERHLAGYPCGPLSPSVLPVPGSIAPPRTTPAPGSRRAARVAQASGVSAAGRRRPAVAEPGWS